MESQTPEETPSAPRVGGAGAASGGAPHPVYAHFTLTAEERAHPLASRLEQGWELYALGDYVAAREQLEPLLGDKAPAGLRAAAEKLTATTQIDLPSLLGGAALVTFFIIILIALY